MTQTKVIPTICRKKKRKDSVHCRKIEIATSFRKLNEKSVYLQVETRKLTSSNFWAWIYIPKIHLG